MADAHGPSLAVPTASGSPYDITLVEATAAEAVTVGRIRRLIGELTDNSNPHDEKLTAQGTDLIAPPHCPNRKKPAPQDDWELRRYKRRWQVEQLFA